MQYIDGSVTRALSVCALNATRIPCASIVKMMYRTTALHNDESGSHAVLFDDESA